MKKKDIIVLVGCEESQAVLMEKKDQKLFRVLQKQWQNNGVIF